MNESSEQPRWLYRFDNYQRAFGLLHEGIGIIDHRPLTQLEKEGIVQRFEYTWELAWKLLKDYLDYEGVVTDKITPAAVLRSALAARIITDGDVWMSALDARNKMSHVYNAAQFEQAVAAIVGAIKDSYLAVFQKLYLDMSANYSMIR